MPSTCKVEVDSHHETLHHTIPFCEQSGGTQHRAAFKMLTSGVCVFDNIFNADVGPEVIVHPLRHLRTTHKSEVVVSAARSVAMWHGALPFCC